jgi:hypothetical protein
MVFVLFGWGVGIARLSDNSFFWHLRTGELILDSGVPHHDPFSYTAHGTPWVAQSWLAELLYGVLDRVGGPFAVRLLGGLVGVAISVLVFRLALRLAGEPGRAALLSIAALAPLYTLWSVRPLVIGVLFLVVLLWMVEVPESWVGRRPLLALPVLFWLWANVHGSFALGFAYLGLHVTGQWLCGRRPWEGRERTLVIGTLVAFAVTFANPYGIDLVAFPIDLLSRGEVLRDVVEWSSPSFATIRGQAFALWVMVFALVVLRGRRGVTRRDLLVAIPFVLLGFWALRNIVVAPLVGLPIAARLVARQPALRRESISPHIGRTIAGLIGLIIVAVGIRAATWPDFRLSLNPVRALHSLEEEGLLGRKLLTDDSDSGYVILRYWPEQKVFLDDRFDMYPVETIEDFSTVSNVERGWPRVLEKHDVEVVIWERSRPLARAMRLQDGWHVVYRDATWITFVRDDVNANR